MTAVVTTSELRCDACGQPIVRGVIVRNPTLGGVSINPPAISLSHERRKGVAPAGYSVVCDTRACRAMDTDAYEGSCFLRMPPEERR